MAPRHLSARETEILSLMARDYTAREIATNLGITLHTVRTHSENILRKLGVHHRAAAVGRALVTGDLTIRDIEE